MFVIHYTIMLEDYLYISSVLSLNPDLRFWLMIPTIIIKGSIPIEKSAVRH